ncbi:MAG TPA: hypothetical protein VE967_06305 [Gemmatimonadaceae bacterium]|nr:hypothetical protein [Gemmatimonadaceae bacterium]
MSTNTDPDSLDAILAKLAREVESAVHAMYRRQAGPQTTQVRTDQFVRAARDRITSTNAVQNAPRTSAPTGSAARFSAAGAATSAGDTKPEWTTAEAAAVTKCVMAWLPMGSPTSAAPDSRCVPPGRELMPVWSERELARGALRKVPVV